MGTPCQREGGRGVERLSRARKQAEVGPNAGAWGGTGRGLGPGFGPAGGGESFFPFSFYFLISISHFAPFSFEQNILWIL